MKQEIKIPRMGESISEATIGSILKESGSYVQMDEEVLEIETDKVNQVLYAPVAGTLTLSVKPEQVVKIGDTVGFVDSEGKKPEVKKEEPSAEKKSESKKAPPPEKKSEIKQTEKKMEAESVSSRRSKESYLKGFKPVEPEKEPSSESLKAFSKPPSPTPGERREVRKKLSKVRRVIGERMLQAQATTASLTTFNEVDLTQVVMLRERYKDTFAKEYGVKLGMLSFFVKAAVSALKEYPELNAYLDGEEIAYREYFDIGIAVSTDRGVIVPVVRNCDHLSFAEIETAIESFAQKTRQGTIAVGDLQGGGFTITNGGVFGSLLSTPILSPPQTGILGMHKIVKRPVAIGDQVLIRPMMYLALTYDHRVIDGREAVSFLVHVKQHLEDPARLLLDI